MAIVQCSCGQGTYDNEKYGGKLTQCFKCSVKGKVKCPACNKKWVDPKRYNACFECNTDGRRALCPYCQNPDNADVEFRNENGTSLLCGLCYRTYGPIIVGVSPIYGSSYTPDFGTREPVEQGFAPPPPSGFGFDVEIQSNGAPAGFDIPMQTPETVVFEEEIIDRPQVFIPWDNEWVNASDYRMPDHNIVCYTREGKFPTDWKSRKVQHIIREGESLGDFVDGFIPLLEMIDPNTFEPMECVCLNYDPELCPNDGKPIFNGEAVCLDCINTPSGEQGTKFVEDTVPESIGMFVDPPPF